MREPQKLAAVLFDLDGTLVDSAPDLAGSVRYALGELALTSPSITELRSYIGNGASQLIHRALTGNLHGRADDALHDLAVPRRSDGAQCAGCEQRGEGERKNGEVHGKVPSGWEARIPCWNLYGLSCPAKSR